MREKDECNWIMRDPQEESLRIDTVRVSSEKKNDAGGSIGQLIKTTFFPFD